MADEAEGEVVVPPTLHALLAARLDQLEPAERRILECGAIEGEIFHRGAIQALAPEETQVTPRLAALVRKELIRPDRPQIAGEDGFRFRHLLIRDAAYEALPKSARADLHQRLGAWLEEHGTELVELDEILGYHLEQALAYRVRARFARRRRAGGCGRETPDGSRLARARASGFRCGRAPPRPRCRASTADRRSTFRSSSTWRKLSWKRAEAEEALRRAESLAERAAARGDRLGELCGRLQHGIILMYIAPEGAAEQLDALAVQALPELLAVGRRCRAAHRVPGAWMGRIRPWPDGLRARRVRPCSPSRAARRPHRRAQGLAFDLPPLRDDPHRRAPRVARRQRVTSRR